MQKVVRLITEGINIWDNHRNKDDRKITYIRFVDIENAFDAVKWSQPFEC